MNTLVEVEPTDVPAIEERGSEEGLVPEPGSLEAANEDRSSRDARISLAAYYRAEARGFAAGAELDDWLAAEAHIDGAELTPADSGQHVG